MRHYNGVTIRVTLGDISASLHSHVVPGRILCPSAVTFGEIVSGMCVRGSFWPPLVAHSPCFSTDAHFICELKAKVCVYRQWGTKWELVRGTVRVSLNGCKKISIPDLIWVEMFKFYKIKTSKAHQTPSTLARVLPFWTLIPSLVCQYYPIPNSEDEVKDVSYFGK